MSECDTKEGILEYLEKGLDGLNQLAKDRHRIGYDLDQRMNRWILLGRFHLDTCGNFSLIKDEPAIRKKQIKDRQRSLSSMSSTIQERILKLFALSDNNSNVHEAARAAELATQLMLDHQISVEELQDSVDPILQEIFSTQKRSTFWKGILFRGIADSFGCRAFSRKAVTVESSNSRKVDFHCNFVIVGTKENISAVRYVYAAMEKTIEALCKRQFSDQKLPKGRAKTLYNSFKVGAVEEIVERMSDRRRDFLINASEQALVPIERMDERLEEFLSKFRLKQVNRKLSLDEKARNLGQEAGRSVKLASSGSLGEGLKQLGS